MVAKPTPAKVNNGHNPHSIAQSFGLQPARAAVQTPLNPESVTTSPHAANHVATTPTNTDVAM